MGAGLRPNWQPAVTCMLHYVIVHISGNKSCVYVVL